MLLRAQMTRSGSHSIRGGNEKKVGWFEDANNPELCRVDAVNETYGRSATGSQIGYACDSSPGSSGSPIVEVATGKVIGLHHFGNVDFAQCRNGGTAMQNICGAAGDLLNCDGGGQICLLLPKGSPCSDDNTCCSGKCKGRSGAKTCK